MIILFYYIQEPTDVATTSQPQPTNEPTSPPPTMSSSPTVECLCCLSTEGFGDYFKLEAGGPKLSSGGYGLENGLTCTAAFLENRTTTLDLPLDICEVELLLVGGGGGGGGATSIAGSGGGAGKCAFVLFCHVLWCVQYEDLVTWLFI